MAVRTFQCRAGVGAHRRPVQCRFVHRTVTARLRGSWGSAAKFSYLGANRFHGWLGPGVSSRAISVRTDRRLSPADRSLHGLQRGVLFVRRQSNARAVRSRSHRTRHRRRHHFANRPIHAAQRIPEAVKGGGADRLGPVQHYALHDRDAGRWLHRLHARLAISILSGFCAHARDCRHAGRIVVWPWVSPTVYPL